MNREIRNILFFLLAAFTGLNAQPSSVPENTSNVTSYFQNGIEFLRKHDLKSAEKMFQKSIQEFSDAPSMYELAKLYRDKNTIMGRDRARNLLKKAIWKEPKNMEYRMLQASLMEKFGLGMAFNEYEDMTEADSSFAAAWFNMGRIKEADFNEYHNSVFMEDYGSPLLSLEKFALEDMQEAEGYFKKALRFDPKNLEARLHMAFLYEDAGLLDKAIPLLQEMIKIDSTSKEAHLYLGLIYYKTSKIKQSHEEYKKALKLMSYDEEVDFTYNSVKELLEPLLGEMFKKYSKEELRELIELYWKVNDPLNLTDYNERLLEHYSRVAYANLRFTSKTDSTPGWKTDRGEVILRYGDPLQKIRYRPHINAGGKTNVRVKTDVWQYKGLTFGFTDEYMSGNYRFSVPSIDSRYTSQFPGDSQMLMEYMRKQQYDYYEPKFEGPVFQMPYYVAQFRNLDEKKYARTDVYVSYALNFPDSVKKDRKFTNAHNYGIFFTDKNYEPRYEKKNIVAEIPDNMKIRIESNEDYFVNSVLMTAVPDSGLLAIEVLRNIDNGVSSSHTRFKIKEFSSSNFEVSDLLLASDVSTDPSMKSPVKRKNINILPNPLNTFSRNQNLYLYYEVYNLSRNKDSRTDFEQKITITGIEEESGIKKIFNAVTGFLGLSGKKEQVSLTSRYQTNESDSQMYIQLDMSGYGPGDYLLQTVIKDNLSQKEASSEVILHWR